MRLKWEANVGKHDAQSFIYCSKNIIFSNFLSEDFDALHQNNYDALIMTKKWLCKQSGSAKCFFNYLRDILAETLFALFCAVDVDRSE